MARAAGLEALVAESVATLDGLTTTGMFGGMAWLRHGHLLCGARHDGILVRLGKGRDGWALAHDDIKPMLMGAKPMEGWVRAGPAACGDDALRAELLAAAVAFVDILPAK